MSNIIGSGRGTGKCPAFSPTTFQVFVRPLHEPNFTLRLHNVCKKFIKVTLCRRGNLVPRDNIS